MRRRRPLIHDMTDQGKWAALYGAAPETETPTMKYNARTPLALDTATPEGRNVTVRGTTYNISHRDLIRLTDDIIRDWAVHCLMDEVVDEACELDIKKTLTPRQIESIAGLVFDRDEDAGFWDAIIERGCPMHEQGIREAVEDCHWNWREGFEAEGLLDED